MGGLVSTLAFPAPPVAIGKEMLLSRQSEMVWLTTKKGLRVPAIHIQNNAKYTLLYSHGNAEDVGLSLNYLDYLSRACNANIFAYEYPGYSIAKGERCENNCYEAIESAYEYLTKGALSPSQVVLFGRSIGTGPTVDLASKEPNLGGCILQSPLESGIRCVMGSAAGYALYPLDIFRSYQKVDKIKCPVFIMHGDADKVVPCSNGRALYKTLQQQTHHVPYDPLWISWAGHNNMPEAQCLQACREFLRFLDKRKVKEDTTEDTDGVVADGSIVNRMMDCMK